MTIDLNWGDFDQTVLLMNINGNWTGEEFHHAIHDFMDKANQAQGTIELMVDLRQSLKPPQNIVTMVRSILRLNLPKNIEQVVVISQTSFWERIFSTIRQMTGNRISTPVIFVKSVDEAYNRLHAFSEINFDIAQS